MIIAKDSNGNRVHANSAEKGYKYYCQACGEEVRLRRGLKNIAHFAHLQDTKCFFCVDKDNKTEWHRRMQNYFPEEAQEKWFKDEETGRDYYADVFLEESNTVLEFQHSHIDEDEFVRRTDFHLKNKRKIAWFFDESSQSSNNTYGMFKHKEDQSDYWYNWMYNRRRFLRKCIDLKRLYGCCSIYVYTGVEGDVFHRIVDQDDIWDDVRFSEKVIDMKDFNTDQVFEYDEYWQWLDEMVKARQSLQPQPPNRYMTIKLKPIKGRRRTRI